MVERLDFRAKKAWLREVSDRHARRLSHFTYASFHALLISRAEREGVEVIAVNLAFTSVIGKIKFMFRVHLPGRVTETNGTVIGSGTVDWAVVFAPE